MKNLNLKAVSVWALAIGALVFMAQAGGCRMDELITVDVPEGVQAVTGVQPEVTLRDSEYVREDYIVKTTRELAILDENISDGRFWEGFAVAAMNTGFEAAVPFLGTIPAGGLLIGLLGTIAGRYLKRPGEDARVEANWDEAFEAGKKAILEGANANAGTPDAK